MTLYYKGLAPQEIWSLLTLGRSGFKMDLCWSDSERYTSNGSYDPSKHEKNMRKCPARHVSVIVSEELKQYFIPITYFSHRVFTLLLDKTHQELGYCHCREGGIVITCDEDVFVQLVQLIQGNNCSCCIFDSGIFEDLLEQLNDVTELYSGPQIIE